MKRSAPVAVEPSSGLEKGGRRLMAICGGREELYAKAIQLAGRIAAVPTAIGGLPAAITSLNYLKQIVVTKGISLRFVKLVDEIRPGLR